MAMAILWYNPMEYFDPDIGTDTKTPMKAKNELRPLVEVPKEQQITYETRENGIPAPPIKTVDVTLASGRVIRAYIPDPVMEFPERETAEEIKPHVAQSVNGYARVIHLHELQE